MLLIFQSFHWRPVQREVDMKRASIVEWKKNQIEDLPDSIRYWLETPGWSTSWIADANIIAILSSSVNTFWNTIPHNHEVFSVNCTFYHNMERNYSDCFLLRIFWLLCARYKRVTETKMNAAVWSYEHNVSLAASSDKTTNAHQLIFGAVLFWSDAKVLDVYALTTTRSWMWRCLCHNIVLLAFKVQVKILEQKINL